MAEIDASIPLAAKAPAVPNIVDQYTRLQTLRDLTRQQDQAAQTAELELKRKRQEIQDQNTAQSILEKHNSFEEALPELQQTLGARAGKLVEGVIAQRKQILSMNDEAAKQAEQNLTTINSNISKVFEYPAEQRELAYQNVLRTMEQAGIITPKNKSMIAPHWDDDLFIGVQDRMKSALDALKIRKEAADAQKAEQEAAGTTPITPYQQATLDQQKTSNVNEPELALRAANGDAAAGRALGLLVANRLKEKGGAAGEPMAPDIHVDPNAAPGQLNTKVLESLPPGEANIIKGMIEGRINIPSGMSASKEPWISRLRIANAYDPAFDQTNWQNRVTVRREFNTGKEADQIRSLNTLIKHLGQLWDASDALDNTGLTGGTKLGSYLTNLGKEQFGSQALKDWDVAAAAAGGEIAALLKGGVPGKEEIEQQVRNFNRNDPKKAQKEAIRKTWELAVGRLQGLESQWDMAFHAPHEFKFINPNAEKALKKMGLESGEKNYAPKSNAPGVDPKVKAYADKYFKGDIAAAQAAIAQQRGGK